MTMLPPQIRNALASLAASMLLAACSETAARRPLEAVVAPAEAPAGGSVVLAFESDVPLEPVHLVELGPGRFVGADPRSPALWLFTPGGAPPRRVALLDPEGRSRLLGISLGPTGLGVLNERGEISVLDTVTFVPLHTIPSPAPAGIRPLGLVSQSDSTWLVLSQEMRGTSRETVRAAMLVMRRLGAGIPATLVWEAEKWNVETMGPATQDRVGVTAVGDTVYVSGSLPPRVTRYVSRAASEQTQILSDAPVRPGSPNDLRAQAEAFRRLPPEMRDLVPPLRSSPAVLRAWPVTGGSLVMASGPDRSVALDAFCGGRFRRTLLSGDEMRDLYVTPGAVVVVRRSVDDTYRLDFYTPGQLDPECAS